MEHEHSFPENKCRALHKDGLRCETPKASDSPDWCTTHSHQKAQVYQRLKQHEGQFAFLEHNYMPGFTNPEEAVNAFTLYNEMMALRILVSLCFYPDIRGIDVGHSDAINYVRKRRDNARANIMIFRRKGVSVDLTPYISVRDWVNSLRETNGLLTDSDRIRDEAIPWEDILEDDGFDYSTANDWIEWGIRENCESDPGPAGNPPVIHYDEAQPADADD